ncbi:MAG: hypothetical protein KBC17_03205 [Candidatus Pacebacteria bacterium]|nr:hypothetical protein [Candidatus Paceibacterota bacterium]
MSTYEKEQDFYIEIEFGMIVKHTDSSEAIKKMIDDITKFTNGKAKVSKIKLTHNVVSI